MLYAVWVPAACPVFLQGQKEDNRKAYRSGGNRNKEGIGEEMEG